MTPHQKIVALILSLLVSGFVIELVRKRKLREEFSLIWVLISLAVILFAIWELPLRLVQRIVGTEIAVNALFFLAIVFLIVINVYLSMKISILTTRNIRLAQRVALLEERIRGLGSRD